MSKFTLVTYFGYKSIITRKTNDFGTFIQASKFNWVWKGWISSAKFSTMTSHVAFGHYHRFVNQINEVEAVKCILKRESCRDNQTVDD